MNKMNEIKEARKKINDKLKEDKDFRATYVCGITTILYENFPDIKISFKKKKDYVNGMSDKLLDFIFG